MSAPTSSSSRAARIGVLLLCLLAFVWMEAVEITRFLSGRWYLADVGNIHYTLVNTLHGRFMESPMHEANHFGFHFTPFLLLLAPFTLASRWPIPLVTSYVLALALCPLPLFHMARNAGLSPWAGVAAGVLFLGNVFVGSIQLANHFEVFFVLFFLTTMALATEGRWPFWAAALLTLSVKEDAAAWLGAYAVLLAWRGRRRNEPALRRRAGVLGILCLAWLVLAAAVLWFVGSRQHESAASYVERAGALRCGWDNLLMLGGLFVSTGFLALLGGASTLLVLVPAPLLLPEFPFTRNLLYYYSYPFIPYLMLATVEGMARLWRWLFRCGWPQHRAAWAVALFAAAVGLVQVPLPTRTDSYRRFLFPVTARDWYRLSVAQELLPPDAPAVIQFGLWGITPTRSDARKLSARNITPEAWIFLDPTTPHGLQPGEYEELTGRLEDEVLSGTRPLIHERGQIYLIGPRIDS